MSSSDAPPQRDFKDFLNSAEGYKLIIDSLTEYAFIAFNPSNEVSSWNSGAERLLGYREEEILGKSGSVFFTPEDIATGQMERELYLAKTEGQAQDERWHVRRDGSRFWGSGWMFPILDGGTVQGCVKVMRDLTERRQHEEALRKSEQRLRLVIDSIQDFAVIDLDPEGDICGWNAGAERLFGYAPREIVGQTVKRLFTATDVQAGYIETELAQSVAEGRAEDERWLLRKGGEQFFANWITNPLRDGNGCLRGFVTVLRDDTGRKQAEEEKSRQQSQMDERLQFTGRALEVSKAELRLLAARLLTTQEDERRRIARELHDDVMQKLAALELHLNMLQESATLVAGARQEFERLILQTTAIQADIRNVSHRLHPAILEDLGLEVALQKLVEDFQKTRSEPIRLSVESVPGEIAPQVASALYRIAQEALGNIRKHAAHSTVTVALDGSGDQLRLRIEDDGPGFDITQRKRSGGLGLVSMDERARLVGGSIGITSSPGSGTVLEASIPWA